jgi:beta-galactosidase/beta-glucuronidase
VAVGGQVVAIHEGGYDPFAVDITEAVDRADRAGTTADVVVDVIDDPDDLDAPRGKQEWLDEPHGIWYPRTTGIWRSTWLESVPAVRLGALHWSCDVDAMTVGLAARVEGVAGAAGDGLTVRARLRAGGRLVAEGTVRVGQPEATMTLRVGDGGFDDRLALVWRPRRPVLLDAEVALVDDTGSVVDTVASTTALRSLSVEDGRVRLNGRPQFLRFALDQGYWRETGMTPPDGDALRRDLELARALGFNGVRKHQKVEDPRFFAWADRLGMLVWVEMPSAYRPGPLASRRLAREWAAVVEAHRNHPSVVGWVPVNESWGVTAAATDPRQRALIDALAHLTGALDGTRPVSANDGWETSGGDIVGVHDYTQEREPLERRFATAADVDRVVRDGIPSGRLVDLDRRAAEGRAVVLSEFGGVALTDEEGAWGYQRATSPDDLLHRYRELWAAVHASEALAGACWTQLTDTYQEANGLLRMDRTPKVDPDLLSAATRGVD